MLLPSHTHHVELKTPSTRVKTLDSGLKSKNKILSSKKKAHRLPKLFYFLTNLKTRNIFSIYKAVHISGQYIQSTRNNNQLSRDPV